MFHVGQEILLNHVNFTIAEHPQAPGVPYGQEGRVATVYKLESPSDALAIKVFKKKYRDPMLVRLTKQLQPFARFDGLSVCDRYVLTTQSHPSILARHPDLLYSVVMPWIEGETWMDVILDKKDMGKEAIYRLVKRFLQIMVNLEEQGIAHCDLSGANVMLSGTPGHEDVELVDVEQLFAPGLSQPTAFTAGTPGYSHPRDSNGNWNAAADRFSGAILLIEMMGWIDSRIREISGDESYFDQSELQQNTQRYRTLRQSLEGNWGRRVANLLDQVWNSSSPAECPTFGEWYLAIYDYIEEPLSTVSLIPSENSMNKESLAKRVSYSGEEPAPTHKETTSEAKKEKAILYQTGVEVQTGVLEEKNSERPKGPVTDVASPSSSTSTLPSTVRTKPRLASVSDENPVSTFLSIDERWQPDSIPDAVPSSRANLYLAAFVGIGALIGLLILVFNDALNDIANAVWHSGGYGIYISLGSSTLSFIVSLVQVWIFRYRLPSEKRIWFVLATTGAGIAGGLVAGIFLSSSIISWSLVGLIIGIVGGPLASFAQSTLMRNNEAKGKWIIWNSIGWLVAWTLGWYFGLVVDPQGTIGMAVSALFIIIVIGLSLVWFLKTTPEFEF